MPIDLDTPVKYIKGVGPRRASKLSRLGIHTVKDLILFPPRRYLDRSRLSSRLEAGEEVVVVGTVISKGEDGNEQFVTLKVHTGQFVNLVWRKVPFVLKNFKEGDKVIAAGRIYRYGGMWRILFPEYEFISDVSSSSMMGVIPVYPSTEGIQQGFIRKLIRDVLKEISPVVKEKMEFLPAEIKKKRNIPDKLTLLRMLHMPGTVKEGETARQALAYEEMLFFFLNLFRFATYRKLKAPKIVKKGTLTDAFLNNLPFELTDAQKRVIREIEEDMARGTPMHRLLQGDVGSGKTIVSAYTALLAVENGYQAAIMAPTEILAEQLYMVISEFTKDLPVNVELLISEMPSRQKLSIRHGIKMGLVNIAIGTHALITEDVEFRNLGVAIIDEQHRFGVSQRAKLLKKGRELTPHFLVMTATPIPRTLALTIYGDLDVSIIDEKPHKGKVITRWVQEKDRGKVYQWLFQQVKKGKQAYVVAPLVEHSEKLEVKAVSEIYDFLEKIKPSDIRVGMVHGRMSREERQEVMKKFRNREIDILVATTVIEVGIDVPNATIMVIEHAERFGLSQLHQLRGRIMRSKETAYCILMTPPEYKLSEDAKVRIQAMVEYSDGFKLSEIDLKLRGPGELLGKRQHGLTQFRFADLTSAEHRKIIVSARNDAKKILQDRNLFESAEIKRGLEFYHPEESIAVG